MFQDADNIEFILYPGPGKDHWSTITMRWGSDWLCWPMELPSHDTTGATPREHLGVYCTQVLCTELFYQQIRL